MERRLGTAGALLILVGFFVVRTAWLSDDAYITLRTVDNFLHGYGLRWNVGERVQVYTHPLWLLLLLPACRLTGDLFYTMSLLAVSASLGAVAVVGLGLGRSRQRILWIALLLVLSKTFLSYATSGLESSLLFL